MDSFRIEFARSAKKDVRAIDRQWIPRIVSAIDALADDPMPSGCKKLVGSDHTYRIRVGDYQSSMMFIVLNLLCLSYVSGIVEMFTDNIWRTRSHRATRYQRLCLRRPS